MVDSGQRKLYSGKSDFQSVELVESGPFGKVQCPALTCYLSQSNLATQEKDLHWLPVQDMTLASQTHHSAVKAALVALDKHTHLYPRSQTWRPAEGHVTERGGGWVCATSCFCVCRWSMALLGKGESHKSFH